MRDNYEEDKKILKKMQIPLGMVSFPNTTSKEKTQTILRLDQINRIDMNRVSGCEQQPLREIFLTAPKILYPSINLDFLTQTINIHLQRESCGINEKIKYFAPKYGVYYFYTAGNPEITIGYGRYWTTNFQKKKFNPRKAEEKEYEKSMIGILPKNLDSRLTNEIGEKEFSTRLQNTYIPLEVKTKVAQAESIFEPQEFFLVQRLTQQNWTKDIKKNTISIPLLIMGLKEDEAYIISLFESQNELPVNNVLDKCKIYKN